MKCKKCNTEMRNYFPGNPIDICFQCIISGKVAKKEVISSIKSAKKEKILQWLIIVLFLLAIISSLGSEERQPHLNRSENSSSNISVLKGGSLVCLSKNSFDTQINLLANNIKTFAPSCFSSSGTQKVILEDISIISGECVVLRVSDKRRLWVACESIN